MDGGCPWPVPPAETGFGIEDLYKLLHQAYCGPGHAIPSAEAAETYLRKEWAGLGPGRGAAFGSGRAEHLGPGGGSAFGSERTEHLGPAHAQEPLIEVPSPDALFVRVHLRPYRDHGGKVESLLAAFLRSAAVVPDPAAFRRSWAEARRFLAGGGLAMRPEEFDAVDARAAAAGYPAIHHSAAYLRITDPAYRVVARGEAEALVGISP